MELYSSEVESTVLGSIIADKDCNIYIKQLEKHDFYIGSNQTIFEILKELYDHSKPIDVISIKELAINKSLNGTEILAYSVKLTDSIITTTTIEYYIKKLKNYRTRRELEEKARRILKLTQEADSDVDSAELKKKALKEITDIKTDGIDLRQKDMANIMARASIELENRYIKKEDNKYTTGYWELDKIIDGLHEQELTVIAARPGVGKTSMALDIAKNISKKGLNTYFVSREMSEIQLGFRMIAGESTVDGHRLRKGWIEDNEWEAVAKATEKLSKLNMIIDTQSLTVQDLETKAYELKENRNLGLIIIDYLQLLRNKEKFNIKEQEVADISRRLKILSMELNIPIIALCQLNREAEKRERPMLSDLRESGAIEQDADNVILLHVSEEEKQKQGIMDVEVIVAKQRNGPTGTIILKYNKKLMSFYCKA